VEKIKRRSFLLGSAGAAGLVNLNPSARGASERLVLALIGARN